MYVLLIFSEISTSPLDVFSRTSVTESARALENVSIIYFSWL